MIRARVFALLLLASSGISGCAGPIETRAGVAGAGLSGQPAIALVSADGSADYSAEAKAAVMQVLQRRGLTVADDAATRLTVALAERPASLGVLADDGTVLSGAKRPRLLQNCEDRTQRLLLVLETAGAAPVRAWAEEDHCKGDLSASLTPLAERAVGALADGRTGVILRSGRD